MKKRIFAAALALCMLLALTLPGMADYSAQESAGAPPERFDVYIQIGDGEAQHFASYTGVDMRAIAKRYNPQRTALKYSSGSYSGAGGRVATEYITVSDFLDYVSSDVGTLTLGSGDYLIMGEDFTKDQSLIDAGYSRERLMGNWFSYDDIVGAKHWYFPEWDSGSDAGAVEVPAAIGLKSYGSSSGVSDELLDLYRTSADYLWAYVLYFGQKTPTEMTYSSFYYGQSQMIIRYDPEAAMNAAVEALLQRQLAEARELLGTTIVGISAETVAQGKFWVTQERYAALEAAVNAAAEPGATNGSGYAALAALKSECAAFRAQRSSGMKSGYF